MSVRKKSGPDARIKTEGLRPPETAVFILGAQRARPSGTILKQDSH
jgi:hypothetical protein